MVKRILLSHKVIKLLIKYLVKINILRNKAFLTIENQQVKWI